MYRTKKLQTAVSKARIAVKSGIAEKAAFAVSKMGDVYAMEFPDEVLTYVEEYLATADMLSVLIDYFLLTNNLNEAEGVLARLKGMCDNINNEDCMFAEEHKAAIAQMHEECRAKIEDALAKEPDFVGDYDKVWEQSERLLAATNAKDKEGMLQELETLEALAKSEFGDRLHNFQCIKTFFCMKYASLKCLCYNNFFHLCREQYHDLKSRYDAMIASSSPLLEQEKRVVVTEIWEKIQSDARVYLEDKRKNMFVPRFDCRCTLCRTRIADETGSHMVPNFLAKKTFSYDGANVNDHEALNFDSLSEPEANRSYYGREVPAERIAAGNERPFKESDLDDNVNLLMYDNEFCKVCEKRFGILETAYSDYYAGRKAAINPRVAYLFWLSVLWRMSMGSMGIFMKIEEELALRELLDAGMLSTLKDITRSDSDLGNWHYVIFQCHELLDTDKGILGGRLEHAPYVISVNDLVLMFMPCKTTAEMEIATFQVKPDDWQTWTDEHKPYIQITRRQFWDVREWMLDTSWKMNDSGREMVLRTVRERERSKGVVVDDGVKQIGIDMRHLVNPELEKSGSGKVSG